MGAPDVRTAAAVVVGLVVGPVGSLSLVLALPAAVERLACTIAKTLVVAAEGTPSPALTGRISGHRCRGVPQ